MIWHLAGWAPRGQTPVLAVDFSVLELLCVTVCWTLIQAARRLDFPRPFRAGLRWIAGAMAFQSAGGLGLIVATIGHGPNKGLVYAAYVCFALSYFLAIVGLIAFPPSQRPKRRRLRALIDVSVFVAGIGVPFGLFSIRSLWLNTTGDGGTPPLMFPILAFFGLLTASWASETRRVLPSREAFRDLVSGIGLLWLANIVLSIDRAYNIIPGGTIRWVNAINAIAFGLCLLGSWRIRNEPVSASASRPLVAFSSLPLITIVVEVAFLLLLAFIGPPDIHTLMRLLMCLGGVLLLLLARETYVIRDGMRLLAADTHEEERSRFEGLVRYSSDVILVVDHHHRVTFASPTAATVLGVPAEALVGRDLLEFIHPEDRSAGANFFDELILDPADTRTIRWRLASANGVYRDLDTAGSNRLQEPMIGGLVLNSHDVTERSALEERLYRSRKMEAIGRLAGGVAHDFNNLLTIIIANAELTLPEIPVDGMARSGVEEIHRAALRGAALTRRMLTFSRTGEIKPHAVLMRNLMQDTTPLLKRAIGERAKLVLRIDAASGGVKVDPDEFAHAMINLATNARDAMSGEGTLTVAAYPATLDAPLADSYLDAAPGSYVVVEVTDTGVGMDEATRVRAFEPFFTTKQGSRGTGLGLASVYGMVKAVGGGISLRTARGAGTTVQLWLPGVPAEAVQQPSAAPESGGRGSETILLLEDEVAVREALQRILVAAGYTVYTAGDGDEAVAVFQRHAGAIELLLADVVIPGRSGPQVARELRLMQSNLKILFMSGYTDQHLASSELIPTGARLLAKPFTREKLTASIRASLSGE